MKRAVRWVNLCLLAVLSEPPKALSQCPMEWSAQISGLPNGTLGNSEPKIAIDYNGALLLAFDVYEADSLIIGEQINTGIQASGNDNALVLNKFSINGIGDWTKTIKSDGLASVLGLTVDAQSNIYISGYFYESLMIDGATFARSEVGPGFFVCKFLANGTLDWFRKGDIGGTSCPKVHFGLGQLYSVITFRNSVSVDGQEFLSSDLISDLYMDALVIQFNPEGEANNIIHVGGGGNLDVRAINCDDQGCIIQGKFDYELIYGEDTLRTPGADHYSMYQIAIDSEGVLQWANVSQNPTDMYLYCYGLGFTDNGEVHFSGVYDYSSFTLGSHTLPAPQQRDVFVGSLERTTGEVLWLKKGSGNMTDFTEAHDVLGNESLLGGFFYSSQFEFEGESFSNTNDNQYDGFIVSLDSTGKARCGLSFPGVGQNGVRAVKKTADGHVMALISMEQLDFSGQSYTAQGRFDLLLIKTCLPCDTLTSITETAQAAPSLQLYPNPASQSVRFQISGHSSQPTGITITDMLGKTVMNLQPGTLNNVILSGAEGIELDISPLPTGIYTVSAQLMDGPVLRSRLVVQR